MYVPSFSNEKIKWQKSDSMVPGGINFNLVKMNIEQMLYNSGKTAFDSRKMYETEWSTIM